MFCFKGSKSRSLKKLDVIYDKMEVEPLPTCEEFNGESNTEPRWSVRVKKLCHAVDSDVTVTVTDTIWKIIIKVNSRYSDKGELTLRHWVEKRGQNSNDWKWTEAMSMWPYKATKKGMERLYPVSHNRDKYTYGIIYPKKIPVKKDTYW